MNQCESVNPRTFKAKSVHLHTWISVNQRISEPSQLNQCESANQWIRAPSQLNQCTFTRESERLASKRSRSHTEQWRDLSQLSSRGPSWWRHCGMSRDSRSSSPVREVSLLYSAVNGGPVLAQARPWARTGPASGLSSDDFACFHQGD